MIDLEVNQKETERYLGYRGVEPDSVSRRLIEECTADLKRECEPKSVYRVYPVKWLSGQAMEIAGMHIGSRSLTRNLKGCTEAVLLAATLGFAPDRLVRRAEIMSMAKTAVYQAAAAALTESYVDSVNKKIRAEAAEKGLFCRPRFSPGYGDLPLALQTDFARILDMPRTVGVTLTDTLLMVPSKSVTAIIGLSETDRNCILEGCEICNRRTTCEFSRANFEQE